MKKVRFETPSKNFLRMDDSECQSPRPFIEKRETSQAPDIYQYERVVYSNDPVQRFEYSDASPYPLAKKTVLPIDNNTGPSFLPSNDLNLSMLDVHEPRTLCRSAFRPSENSAPELKVRMHMQPNVLSSIENSDTPPNILCKDDSFFIRRDNLERYQSNMNPLHKQMHRLNLDKENHTVGKKIEMRKMSEPYVAPRFPEKHYTQQPMIQDLVPTNDCRCHHCIKVQNVPSSNVPQPLKTHCENTPQLKPNASPRLACPCQPQIITCFHCEQHVQKLPKSCSCDHNSPPKLPQNAVDKKTWAIEKFEQSKKGECMEVEKQTNVVKEKREPTIADLVKIIKLQNEQLQLLQEKVDKFITTNNHPTIKSIPVQNYMTEKVALQTIDSEHKISIGVMTSFEMVRTSTVINKEILKQTTDNAQIQCNRSQISIKEVVSKQPVNLNFLDGIMPVAKRVNSKTDIASSNESLHENDEISRNGTVQRTGVTVEDKTLNELSLYNVQVDNATTPLISPEQSLYLDVRDYSDSDSSDDQSNVGWTYYNKVMTHVNGMLQDSDMPSSASALYRNTRQQCVQMQIDKTNVSVTKRVKFGDDPLGIHQPHIYAASTDTSLKMNQLAAKYLNTAPAPARLPKPAAPIDMSYATRNYMEKHKILQGLPQAPRSPVPGEMPRFLDITALKQQPKLL